MTHRLQVEFASIEGEENYVGELHRLFASGDLETAEAILVADLAALDRDLARQCVALQQNRVTLDGWDEMIDTISDFEGDPVTGIAIGIANEPDLAFEKGQVHSPYLTLGIYTDESFAWSAAARDDILAQFASGEPQWSGSEEDIEIFMDIEGLDEINTALIHHKHRFFLRDGDPDIAPEGYVEFVLACWLRALRFHRAVAGELASHALPHAIKVVTGTIDMVPEVVAVHIPDGTVQALTPVVELGSLIENAAPKFNTIPEETVPEVNIRQRVAAAANDRDEQQPEQPQGYFTRVFGRLGVGLNR